MIRSTAVLVFLLFVLPFGYTAQEKPRAPRNNKEQREQRKQEREALKKQLKDEVVLKSERILNYHADITVDTLSKLSVTETIVVNAKGQAIQRGIFRMLPSKREVNNSYLAINYDVISVKKNGVPEPFHTKKQDGTFYIYIGDKNVLLAPSIYEYEIKYETNNQIGYFETFDELYWNVTGNDWMFPIDSASASVHLPAGTDIIQHACYTGLRGSTENNCLATIMSTNTIDWSAQNLKNQEGLTIAVGFKKGIVNAPPLPYYLQSKNLVLILLGLGALILLYMLFHWYKHGIDPKAPTVIPMFEPPAYLSPADISYLTSRRYRSNALPASLISLATKGYIKIIEKQKAGMFKTGKFNLVKLSKGNGRISTIEHKLMSDLFPYGKNEVELDGTYDSSIASAVNYFKTSVTNHNKGLVSHGNHRRKTMIPLLLISIVFIALMIAAYTHVNDIGRTVLGFFFFVVHLFMFFCYLGLKPNFKRIAKWFWIVPLCATLLIHHFFGITGMDIDVYHIAYLFVSISFTVLAIFSYLIEQPSTKFLRLLADIEGFKLYLSAAETPLIQHFNSPKMTPEVFEKFLPYAIVLGVDKIWGEKFENALNNQATSYQSSWYQGGSSSNFNSNFSSSLHSGIRNSVIAASTVPSSSSGGSSGGGSSGGGGGGGGGGGW